MNLLKLGRIAGVLLLLVPTYAIAPSRGQDFSSIDRFYLSFYLSFGYDYCGDSQVGEEVRQLLMSLVEKCALSSSEREEIKQRFSNVRLEVSRLFKEQQAKEKAATERGEVVIRQMFGDQFVCDSERYRAKLSDLKSMIAKFKNSTVSENDVVPETCLQQQ